MMGIKTGIEYCDSTVNPTSGCGGCELWIPQRGGTCYAGATHERFRGSAAYPGPFEQVDLQPGRMQKAAAWSDLTGSDRPGKPWLNGLPRVIFIGDMADTLSRGVPFQYLLDEVIENVDSPQGSRHLWLWFTKRPRRMAAFSELLDREGIDWPAQLMAVTSVTGPKTVRRIRWLQQVRCFLRGVSFGPLRERITVDDLYRDAVPRDTFDSDFRLLCGIDWAVFEGESDGRAPSVPPHPQWFRELIDYLHGSLNVPCFFKQWGSWMPVEYEPGHWPESDDRFTFPDGQQMLHVDRKGDAGRTLDGRTWDQMPRGWVADSWRKVTPAATDAIGRLFSD